MELTQIQPLLADFFPDAQITRPSNTTWQVELPQARLIAIASADLSELRVLLPLAPQSEAQPYLEALLEINFDATQMVHFALHQNVLWSVFYHRLATLTPEDFKLGLKQAQSLAQSWLRDVFMQTTEKQMRQIIQGAKKQGQSLEATLQNIGRFYQEGVLGSLEQTTQERETVMAAWQQRLTQLWDEES